MPREVTRLYDGFKPTNYQLELKPNRAKKTFTGTVIIHGQKTGRPSQRLSFHQNGLSITSATITRHNKNGINDVIVDRINTHKRFDEVRLHAKHMLYPGMYTVELKFTGKITRPMNGIYPCFFKEDGKEKQLIATQFESHHAREVFPCIDEPEAKATFDLTLTTPTGEAVLANTPVKKQVTKNKQLTTTFETTPIMSTYLLAFVYGELGFKEAKTSNGIVVRTYATSDNVKFTQFALEVAVKCLEFYEDYFGIPYPLAKADMVALPDFASGAMENWGLITYREHALLVDPANTTLSSKQWVAMVVAHELAHQWFGNLVTMRWWTDLWLNEGFASWIEYLAVDHLFPEWQMWTQFIVDEQQQAMKLDALEHTHAIEVPIHHPDEIRTIFDAISYSKGSSVIHMLHEYLGPEAFRDGLRHYLKQHAYGNTDTVDLWQALEKISGKPVRKFMHKWTSEPGFPIVSVTHKAKQITLSQQRFFLNPKHGKVAEVHWPIPLLSSLKQDLLETTSITLPVTQVSKINVNQSGFYRTAYDGQMLESFGKAIQKNTLSALDRLSILNDIFESAKAGHVGTIDGLKFLENFAEEIEYPVWDIIAGGLGSIRHVMDDETLRDVMKPYLLQLVSHQFKRLGWEKKPKESHFDQLLRPIILGHAAYADEPGVIKHCKELFAAIDVTGPKLEVDIDPDLRGIIFGTVARLGGKKEFDKLVKMHELSHLSEERTTLAAAITGFEQPELNKQALELIDTDFVRLQDVAYWIAYAFMNRFAKNQTWEWLKTHWDWLEENLGTDLSFYRMPMYVARAFSEEKFIKEYTDFFEPKLSPALDRAYRQGIEMLQWQSAWKERDLKSILAFFKAHPKK